MKHLLILLLSLCVLSCNFTSKNQFSENFPDFLMDEYPFLLGTFDFNTYAAFENDMKDRYGAFGMDLDQIVFNHPRIKIEYFYSQYGRTTDSAGFVLHADNKESFTAGELIYKINHHTYANLKDNEHIFFEGLEYLSIDEDGVPVYCIAQGS